MKELIQLFKWGLIGISPAIVGFLIYFIWGWKVLGPVLFISFIIGVTIMIGAQIKYGILEDDPSKEDKT